MNVLTLAELLSLNILGDAQVLSAKEWLAYRRVEWVSVIELPVEDFVRRDELVLTTGLGCSNDLDTLLGFVEEVWSAGAAGLAIAVGRYINEIPAHIIEVAEGWQFPLLAIPWGVRFADVSRHVYSEISLRTAGNEYSIGIMGPGLVRMAQSENPNVVIETLGQSLRMNVAFFDALTGDWAGPTSFSEWCRKNTAGMDQFLALPRDMACMSYETHRGSVDGQDTHFLPVCSDGRWMGILVVQCTEIGQETMLTQYEGIIKHLVALMCLRRELAVTADINRHKDLVWKLAKGEFKIWDEVVSAAVGFEFDIIQYYVCVVGRLDNWDQLYRYNQTVFHEVSRQVWETDIVRKVQYMLAQSAKNYEYHVISTYRHGEWVAYLFSPKRLVASKMKDVLAGVQRAVGMHVVHGALSWGLAIGGSGGQGFRNAYQNARTALELGIRKEGTGHCFEYEHVNNNQMLARFAVDSSVRDLVQAILGSLVEYDRQHESDLVHTLMIYLQNRTNVTVTARSLHLHRQSLLYRLSKIEFLTGRSLDDPDDLFLLELCLRLVGA